MYNALWQGHLYTWNPVLLAIGMVGLIPNNVCRDNIPIFGPSQISIIFGHWASSIVFFVGKFHWFMVYGQVTRVNIMVSYGCLWSYTSHFHWFMLTLCKTKPYHLVIHWWNLPFLQGKSPLNSLDPVRKWSLPQCSPHRNHGFVENSLFGTLWGCPI